MLLSYFNDTVRHYVIRDDLKPPCHKRRGRKSNREPKEKLFFSYVSIKRGKTEFPVKKLCIATVNCKKRPSRAIILTVVDTII